MNPKCQRSGKSSKVAEQPIWGRQPRDREIDERCA
jgi:hypothetical protein